MLIDTSSRSREVNSDGAPFSESPPDLKPCKYQVAGHLPENGKTGSLVDGCGRFYKPLQPGARGKNELNFYRKVSSPEFLDVQEDEEQWSQRVELLRFVPRFYGSVMLPEGQYLILEDLVFGYRRPCVMDIKIGYRTWYSAGDARYNARARQKDEGTTQSTIGFKICGWQVYDAMKRKFLRVSKAKCKTMSQGHVREALMSFADNKSGIGGAAAVYNSCHGAIHQLRELRNWFQAQKMFKFYSSSILIIYEGDEMENVEDLNVRVRWVDFAHTFPTEGVKDRNFQDGLSSLMEWLVGISEESTTQQHKQQQHSFRDPR